MYLNHILIEIWKTNVFEFDFAELYLIQKCVFGPNPDERSSAVPGPSRPGTCLPISPV